MIKKIIIDDTVYDVIDVETAKHNPSIVDLNTAIDIGDGYVYPLRNITDSRPGAYLLSNGQYMEYRGPCREEYSISRAIDFGNSENIKDLISRQAQLVQQERTILSEVDDVYVAEVTQEDTPHMAALKTAINSKHLDLKKYESRFGSNFNNDIRLLNKHDITMKKLASFAEKLDMTVTLTIEDADSDVPNPIGEKIVANIVSRDGEKQ